MNIKTAISLPEEDFNLIENLRKRDNLNRSNEFLRLIRLGLKKINEDQLIKKYVEGYKKNPETIREIKCIEKASFRTLRKEDWE